MNDFFDGKWDDDNKSLYTKIPQGEVKLRILTPATVGWEGWCNNKPVRFPAEYRISKEERAALDTDNYNPDKKKWRQFAVTVVYNYTEECVQYWQFTQAQIRDQLMKLASDTDWGKLTDYDIKVKREGEKVETKYTITPLPKKTLSVEVQDAVAKAGLHPSQLFNDTKNTENVAALRKIAGQTSEEVEASPLDDGTNIPF
jgi:hypothetical protein